MHLCDIPADSDACLICGTEYNHTAGIVTSKISTKPPSKNKPLEGPILGDPDTATVSRVNSCPKDWLIDGREPSNWRQHRAALAVEARRWATQDRKRLSHVLLDTPMEEALWSPLVGETFIPEWKRSEFVRKYKPYD